MIKDILILTIFPSAMALAAASDFLTMTIPNRLVLALASGFFIVAPLAGLGWSDIGLNMALALAAFAFAFALFSFGLIGGGDVKLFAATCLWFGPETLPAYAIYVALFGVTLTLLLLFWRGMPFPSLLPSQGWLMRLHSPKEGVPYGIALAAAGLLVYRETPFVAALGG
jgi:prepilin peptidase CpaA